MSEFFEAQADLATTDFGRFRIFAGFKDYSDDDIVLTKGEVAHGHDVLTRVALACVTSTALHAADCDCSQQLDLALAQIQQEGSGVLIYLGQEGRGHGLVNKVRALANKNAGMDTLEATRALGLPADASDYRHVAAFLAALEVTSIRLMTNNPAKVRSIQQLGIAVSAVVLCIPDHPHPQSLRHLLAKRRDGHTIPEFDG